jgi:hypothetical protein
MTADLYATATGLIERSAAAYASGVPEGAEDDGFFGPSSVTWRVSSDLASPVAGLRSLLMQALHPLAMAGVDQHSGWRRDPVGRLAATSAYLATVTFGERAAAVRARQMYGCGAPPLTPGRRTEIRQSLGVLDAMFLGQPGVLEARQRITLRMRKARRA